VSKHNAAVKSRSTAATIFTVSLRETFVAVELTNRDVNRSIRALMDKPFLQGRAAFRTDDGESRRVSERRHFTT